MHVNVRARVFVGILNPDAHAMHVQSTVSVSPHMPAIYLFFSYSYLWYIVNILLHLRICVCYHHFVSMWSIFVKMQWCVICIARAIMIVQIHSSWFWVDCPYFGWALPRCWGGLSMFLASILLAVFTMIARNGNSIHLIMRSYLFMFIRFAMSACDSTVGSGIVWAL